MARRIKRNKQNGKTIIQIERGPKIELPLDEPVEELTYNLLQFFSGSTAREIAFAIGWEVSRVSTALKKLQKNKVVTMSPCFANTITRVWDPQEKQ